MQTKSLGHDDIKFYPPPFDHRSMEHHYIESLGHPDIKFYPPPTNIYADEFPSVRKYYIFCLSEKRPL